MTISSRVITRFRADQVNRRSIALVELKQELANRGMSAEQIVAVLDAGTGSPK